MTLAIAHREGDRVVLDTTREVRAPFEPAVVVAQFAQVLKSYRIRTVIGDAYSGAWCSSAFHEHGVTYQFSERAKSEIYLDALPLFTNGTALLLDDQRLISQFAQLERRTSRQGRDSVDHGPGGRDDLANAVAGALVHAAPASPVRIENLQRRAIVSQLPRPWRPQREHTRVKGAQA